MNINAQKILFDLIKDKVEWHDVSEVPSDDKIKLIEPDGFHSHCLAYHNRGDISEKWNTGDCGIKVYPKRWAEVPKDYWVRYCNGEFGTYEAWIEYCKRKENNNVQQYNLIDS